MAGSQRKGKQGSNRGEQRSKPRGSKSSATTGGGIGTARRASHSTADGDIAAEVCLIVECGRESDIRGLCTGCYQNAKRVVDGGLVTWDELEASGLAKPCKNRVSPFIGQFNKTFPARATSSGRGAMKTGTKLRQNGQAGLRMIG